MSDRDSPWGILTGEGWVARGTTHYGWWAEDLAVDKNFDSFRIYPYYAYDSPR